MCEQRLILKIRSQTSKVLFFLINMWALIGLSLLCISSGFINGSRLIAPKIATISEPGQMHQNESIRVFCSVLRGSLPIEFVWNLNGNRLDNQTSRIQTDNQSPYSSVLIINSIQSEDQGTLKCLARNDAGLDETEVQLHVQSAPAWNQQIKDISVIVPSSISVICSANATPEAEIRWYHIKSKC